MPIIIKNGKVYGDRSVTLSQAEYNALSEVEKNNGTTYYIYDVNGVVTADDVALDGGTVETLAGSVATFESSPATATHAVGDYILWNGQLYTVTAAIAVGETLTVGTNITSTNVGSELTALNAGLTYKLKGTVTGANVISYPANFDVAKITIEYVFGGSTNFCYTFELTKAELADLTSSSYRFYRQGYYYSASDSGVCTLATTSDFIVLNTLRHGTTDYSASAKVTMYYR